MQTVYLASAVWPRVQPARLQTLRSILHRHPAKIRSPTLLAQLAANPGSCDAIAGYIDAELARRDLPVMSEDERQQWTAFGINASSGLVLPLP